MFENPTAARVRLVCTARQCGTRCVEMPVPVFMRSHGIECDRCGGPMRVIACLAGIDPTNGAIVWSDRDRRSFECRRKTDAPPSESSPSSSSSERRVTPALSCA